MIASVNAGIKLSGLIGRFVKLAIFLLTVTMALEQLGIGRETMVIAFAIIIKKIKKKFKPVPTDKSIKAAEMLVGYLKGLSDDDFL